MSGILVVLESRDGRVSRASWEALAAGRHLAAITGLDLAAVVLGAQTESLAAEVAAQHGGKIVRIEHPLLAPYTADGFTIALAQFLPSESPAYVVFAHTYQVRDYAPALACRFRQALIGDVVAIAEGPVLDSAAGLALDLAQGSALHSVEGPVLHPADKDSPVVAPVFTRQLMQGRLSGDYRPAGGGPCFISVQAGAFRAEALDVAHSSQAAIATFAPITFAPIIDAAQIRTRPGEPFRAAMQTAGTQIVDLGSAQRIVAVGRGIQDTANLPLAEELAAALGAELAASRPICDAGWLPAERQVGSSGQTVSPQLYVAVGISGAIQHLVGMKGSQCIVAINKDPGAPIFEVADYGIAGDLFEVVPALTEAVTKARQ